MRLSGRAWLAVGWSCTWHGLRLVVRASRLGCAKHQATGLTGGRSAVVGPTRGKSLKEGKEGEERKKKNILGGSSF